MLNVTLTTIALHVLLKMKMMRTTRRKWRTRKMMVMMMTRRRRRRRRSRRISARLKLTNKEHVRCD